MGRLLLFSGAWLPNDSVLLQQIQACRSDSQLDKQCYPVVQNRNQHGGREIADPVFFAERQIQTQRNQDNAGDHAELRLYGREGGAPEPVQQCGDRFVPRRICCVAVSESARWIKIF